MESRALGFGAVGFGGAGLQPVIVQGRGCGNSA